MLSLLWFKSGRMEPQGSPKEHHRVTPCNISHERFTGRCEYAEATSEQGWNGRGSRKRRHWLYVHSKGLQLEATVGMYLILVVDDGVATEIGCRDVVFQESLQKEGYISLIYMSVLISSYVYEYIQNILLRISNLHKWKTKVNKNKITFMNLSLQIAL